ncbi:14052_t:CDS:10 [Acaulospora colombiana]|uniref:14052_t:CDS:1 n=1 Tax=Acaulospora colombiana TaxID=27376 RepID=A0ACA9KX53_9GLOM|nr:14052_t:CDS:10 [Acaulospora colombiana]
MEEKIFEFVAKKDINNLSSYLDEVEVEKLTDLVRQQLNDEKKFYDEKKGCFPLICAVFKGSAFEEIGSEGRQIEIEKLRDRRRVMIMMEIVKWSVTIVEVNEPPPDNSSSGVSMSGPDYKDYILNKICTIKWHPSNILSLTGELRDIVMTNEQGQKRLILKGICEHFNSVDEEVDEEQDSGENDGSHNTLTFSQLSHMEGTVIIHICFAVTQDQELGREFLKYMKSGKTSLLTPFNVACMLSIARILRFKVTVLEFLRSSVISAFKDREKIERAKWISKVDTSNVLTYTPIMSLFRKIIRKTSFGWDQVTQSLVQLGILIMDTASGVSTKSTDTFKVSQITPRNASELTSELGITILFEMFKIHDMVRAEILDQILSSIISKSASAENFLNLLEMIVKEAPHYLVNYLPKIRGTLDYLTFLPHHLTDKLLKALQPIIFANQSFRDGLMIVLRKGMSTKDLEGRHTVLTGYLRLLKGHASGVCNTWAMSQLSTGSSHSTHKQDQNSLSFEVLRTLRRCFSQQAEIRLSLYQGLMAAMDVQENLKPLIFDILYPHFKQYFVMETGVHATVNIESCLSVSGEVSILEPLPYLFACNVVYDEPQLKDCENIVELLIERLQNADMSEFMIDPAADFSMNNNEGIRNNLSANLLLGCYEAALEHTFYSLSEPNLGTSEKIIQLFKKYTALFQVIKEKSVSSRGRKILYSTPQNTILSFKCVTDLSKFIFKDITGVTVNHAKNVLGANYEFVKYINAVSYTIISEFTKDLSNFSPEDQTMFEHCASLGQVIMNEFIINSTKLDVVSKEDSKKDKVKSNYAIAIESFTLLSQAVASCWPDRLVEFFSSSYPRDLLEGDAPGDLDGWLYIYVQKFMHLMVLSLSERIPQTKDALVICQTVTAWTTYFTRKTDVDSKSREYVEQLFSWIIKFCKERAVEEMGLSKSLMNLLLSLERDMAEFDTIVEIAKDISNVLGPITARPEHSDAENPQFAIVNPRSSSTVSTLLILFLDLIYDEMEWLLNRMKGLCSVANADSDDESIEMDEVERTICLRLTKLMEATLFLEETSLHPSSSEHLIKCLQKVYKVLVALTKYKLSEAGDIEEHFTDVIKFAGLKLSERMYDFLTAFLSASNGSCSLSRKGKPKATTKSRISKESKMIPDLIFISEQFERYLLQLSKKTKVDFMQYITVSTARDFKIKTEKSKKSKTSSDLLIDDEEDDTSDALIDEEKEEVNGGEGPSEEPPRKRRRSDSSMETDDKVI